MASSDDARWLAAAAALAERGRPLSHPNPSVGAILVNKGRVKVKRRWKWLTWPELREKVFQGLEWDQAESSRGRLFDLDGDGKWSREEQWAAGAALDAGSGRWTSWTAGSRSGRNWSFAWSSAR